MKSSLLLILLFLMQQIAIGQTQSDGSFEEREHLISGVYVFSGVENIHGKINFDSENGIFQEINYQDEILSQGTFYITDGVYVIVPQEFQEESSIKEILVMKIAESNGNHHTTFVNAQGSNNGLVIYLEKQVL